MTARLRHPGKEPELDAYDVIARARAALPRLTTESLSRIRELVREALEGRRDADEAIAGIARTLDPGA